MLIEDEKLVIKQLSALTKALEIVSDVDIQYASVMAAMDSAPILIQELETLTLSVLQQRLTANMMPLMMRHHFSLLLLMHAEIYVLVTPKGYVIRYKIMTTFEVIKLRTLPFPISNSLFGKVKLENNLVPISNEGYSFLYSPGTCVEKDSTLMCRSTQITIHAQPITCAKQLAFGPPLLPEKCKQNIQAIIPVE
jgi:hypothetical protein